jgi:hypothetical protein
MLLYNLNNNGSQEESESSRLHVHPEEGRNTRQDRWQSQWVSLQY